MNLIWLSIALLILILILAVASRPAKLGLLESRPAPISSYDDAVARVQAIQEEENQDLTRDVCITKLYDHGKQTEHVIILIHGFTNCPEQFNEIGQQHFEAGNNVLIPRMPYHGLTDRMTEALVNLNAEDIAAFGDRVIDMAHGLGKRITVMGVSGSGTLVAWLAQNRADIHFAFALAPLFGLAMIPPALTKLFERVALHLPDFFLWWDPRTKAENPYSIYYAYPRYPVRALVQFLRLAMITRLQAEKSPPKAGHFTMIINDAEPAVSNGEITRFLKVWRKHGSVTITEVHLEREMKLPHDIITPGTPDVPIAVVQRRLINAIREIHAK